MALHSQNAVLRRIINSPDLHKKYPTYGFLLELQFRKGSVRRPLLEKAKVALHFFATCSLPDACTEKICQHLNDEDLIETVISSKDVG